MLLSFPYFHLIAVLFANYNFIWLDFAECCHEAEKYEPVGDDKYANLLQVAEEDGKQSDDAGGGTSVGKSIDEVKRILQMIGDLVIVWMV